jgi:hypothetical protein
VGPQRQGATANSARVFHPKRILWSHSHCPLPPTLSWAVMPDALMEHPVTLPLPKVTTPCRNPAPFQPGTQGIMGTSQ